MMKAAVLPVANAYWKIFTWVNGEDLIGAEEPEGRMPETT